jgi:hypothetical protein
MAKKPTATRARDVRAEVNLDEENQKMIEEIGKAMNIKTTSGIVRFCIKAAYDSIVAKANASA